MPNPDYFSNFNPKCCSDKYSEVEEEQIKKDLFELKNLRKNIILD
ncbi:MAG: hypothetical protein WC979_07660 [Candidatus Pacearchaeota archaeon]|jgi:hypothetical protein